jgi:hypothetical protein
VARILWRTCGGGGVAGDRAASNKARICHPPEDHPRSMAISAPDSSRPIPPCTQAVTEEGAPAPSSVTACAIDMGTRDGPTTTTPLMVCWGTGPSREHRAVWARAPDRCRALTSKIGGGGESWVFVGSTSRPGEQRGYCPMGSSR